MKLVHETQAKEQQSLSNVIFAVEGLQNKIKKINHEARQLQYQIKINELTIEQMLADKRNYHFHLQSLGGVQVKDIDPKVWIVQHKLVEDKKSLRKKNAKREKLSGQLRRLLDWQNKLSDHIETNINNGCFA